MEVLLGQVLTGELWNLAIYGKGLLHQAFLDHRHRLLESSICQFCFCPHSLVPMVEEGRARFGSRTAGGQGSHLCTCLWCAGCVVSER